MTYSILAISGSLRAGSINTEVLRALQQIAPPEVALNTYDSLAALPHFNPDNETDGTLEVVSRWRLQLQRADAVVICSPEYAHGVPGALKNALDWVVGTGEFMGKPVSLISASPSSRFVRPQLTETLTVMMANVVPDACATLSLSGRNRDAVSMMADEVVRSELLGSLNALVEAIRTLPAR